MKIEVGIKILLVIVISLFIHLTLESKPVLSVCDAVIEIEDIEAFQDETIELNVNYENVNTFTAAIVNSTIDSLLINALTGKITIDPINPGTHKVVIIGIKDDTCIASRQINLVIYDRPDLYETYPIEKNIETFENQPVIFQAKANDTDTDEKELIFDWYVDDDFVRSGENFEYKTDFHSEGEHEIKVIVTDDKGLENSDTWNVFVKNVNQAPFQIFSMPDIKMYADSTVEPYNLNTFFKDPDEDLLKFSYNVVKGAHEVENTTFELQFFEDGDYYIRNKAFTGFRTVVIKATDPEGLSIEGNPFIIESIPNVISCGDGICIEESCDTCPQDCGACLECIENWVCGDWQNCTEGELQIRECIDLNNCSEPRFKPNLTQACPYTCNDGIQNQGEEDIDCGGPCVPCETCSDGIQNQDETDVDCGGVCPGCSDGNSCIVGLDCRSNICDANYKCKSATCNDNTRNQGEEGIDCGGPCDEICPSCTDGVQNGGEVGVDCGGVCKICATCNDGILNQDEERIDCGGNSCRKCNLYDYVPSYVANPLFILIGIILFILLIIILHRFGIFSKMLNLDDNISLLLLISKITVSKKRNEPTNATGRLFSLLESTDTGDSNFEKRTIEGIKEYLITTVNLSTFDREDHFFAKLDMLQIPEITKKLLSYLYHRIIYFESSRILVSMEIIKFITETKTIIKETQKVI